MDFHPQFKSKIIDTHFDRQRMIKEIRDKDKEMTEANFEYATDRQIISILKEINDPWTWTLQADEDIDRRTQHQIWLDNES